MAERPRFSQILVDRRRDLGLSIEQAAQVLKMKEQVLRAFESGDWQAIPRAGYAQGMLSSYARYLGLNPRDVIDEFKQDLYHYTHSEPEERPQSTRESRAMGYADRYQGQRPRRAPTGDIDLYGSAGPAGSVYSGGTFDDEMRRRLIRERGGHRGAGYSERYLREQTDSMPRQRPDGGRGGRRYTARTPERPSSRSAKEPRGTRRSSRAKDQARRADERRIRERRVDASAYEDDLRYDPARSFEAASSERGRRASRHIASTERPDREEREGRRGRRERQSQPSFAESLFADRRVIIGVVLGLFALVLVAVLFTVNSCVAHVTSTEKPEVPVSQTQADVDDGSSDAPTAGSGEDAEGEGNANQGTGTPTTTQSTAPTAPSSVTVQVADGQVSWIEIVMGDVSLVAQTVSGPWEKTFTPTAPMEIQASDAAAVTVTADGKQLSFDAKASGVGVLTIPGPESAQTTDPPGAGDAGVDGEYTEDGSSDE